MTIITETKSYRKPDYEIDEMFINRWSPRSFLDKEIPEEVLLTVFEAARWAPSAYNEQPWRFIIAKTKEERERFYPFISEFNLSWCKKAPVLVLILSKTTRNGEFLQSHSFDAGAAWAHLALQANKCGLITHPMTGFDFDRARETLEIPEDYAIEALVAIGYQGEKEALSEKLQEREQPNGRRPIKESLFTGKFGNELK
ncbi:nitroreductase family protein [Pallidibacillus thermolactis]|jgi:nitroreductase|uniref:nitroreductase family protein n=1 Tax=Pallidibacillus thermolactis TaxID=251051 RepID=UPI0035EF7DDB